MNALKTIGEFLNVSIHGHSPVHLANHTRRDLCRLFAALGYRTGAEVGVWRGAFAEKICQANPGVHLTAIDPWTAYPEYQEKKNQQPLLEDAYQEAAQRLGRYSVGIMRMTSQKAAARIADGSLDFVYIDANHKAEFVYQDLVLWTPKIRPGGILAGHDYSTNPAYTWIEVPQAVNRFTAERGIAPWFVLGAETKAPSYFWVVS